MTKNRLMIAGCLTACLSLATTAGATTSYPDQLGPIVSFTGMQETSSSGDPEPLFGAPLASGTNLIFTPLTFSASAAGAGGFDQTGSQFQGTVTVTNPLDTIDSITFNEAGDVDLSGIGTAATGAFLSMAGFVTVLEDLSGPIAPVVVPFVGVFSQDLYGLPGDLDVTTWTASAFVDLSALDATKVIVSWDNDLTVFSEGGTTVLAQKKVGTEILVVVPEPAGLALVALGMLAALRSNRGHH